MTKVEASKVVAVLLAAYPNSKITSHTSGVYEDALADLEYELCDRAVRALIMTEPDFMSTPGKVREMAFALQDGVRRHGGDAFGDVRKAVGRFGRDRGADAMRWLHDRDPVAALVLDRLGWREFCNSDENDAAFRAQFIRLYDLMTNDRARIGQTAGLLAPPRQTPLLGQPSTMGQAMRGVLAKVGLKQLPASTEAEVQRNVRENDLDDPPWDDEGDSQ